MKLTSLEFTLIVATLFVMCGASYKLGQESVQPIVLVNPTPAPAATPALPPIHQGRVLGDDSDANTQPPVVYMIKGGRYYHFSKDCHFASGPKWHKKAPYACPKCAGGS